MILKVTTTEISAKIRAFLTRFVGDRELQGDDDIFRLGFVNSLFAMQLVLFVEKTFGIKVMNEDLDVRNFNTLAALTAFVERKLQVDKP